MIDPKITLTFDGIEEIKELIERAYRDISKLENTVGQLRETRLEIEAKINQPSAVTDD